MSTLIKRIIFIALILGIAYGVYWMIDRKGADELKQNIVTTTQKTVRTIDSVSENILPTESGESLGEGPELVEKNIVVTNPEVKEPVVVQTTTKTTVVKKTSSPKTTTSSSSSNVLFDLFK